MNQTDKICDIKYFIFITKAITSIISQNTFFFMKEIRVNNMVFRNSDLINQITNISKGNITKQEKISGMCRINLRRFYLVPPNKE